MLKRKLLVLLLSTISSVFYAQEILYVNADNGLLIREAPNRKAKRIGKFKYAEKVEVQEKTGIQLSVIDNGEKIKGSWVKVEGFVKKT